MFVATHHPPTQEEEDKPASLVLRMRPPPSSRQSSNSRWHADKPVHVLYHGRVVHRHTSKNFLSNQHKSSHFALTSHDSLVLFIFFHSEVYMIENNGSEKGDSCFFFFSLDQQSKKKNILLIGRKSRSLTVTSRMHTPTV